jgi:hypothetical protein
MEVNAHMDPCFSLASGCCKTFSPIRTLAGQRQPELVRAVRSNTVEVNRPCQFPLRHQNAKLTSEMPTLCKCVHVLGSNTALKAIQWKHRFSCFVLLYYSAAHYVHLDINFILIVNCVNINNKGKLP